MYARQNVKHDSRKKHMVDGNDIIRPWKSFFGGQIGVDEGSKNLDFDCIMKEFFWTQLANPRLFSAQKMADCLFNKLTWMMIP